MQHFQPFIREMLQRFHWSIRFRMKSGHQSAELTRLIKTADCPSRIAALRFSGLEARTDSECAREPSGILCVVEPLFGLDCFELLLRFACQSDCIPVLIHRY